MKSVNSATAGPSRPSATSETVVLHAGYPLWRKHTLVAMARAKELQDNGADVIVTYCNAARGTCLVNLSGSAAACAVCRSRIRKTAAANGLTAVPLNIPAPSENLTLDEKRDIVEGVHSAVISEFRQLPGDDAGNPIVRIIKRRYFRTACNLLKSMKSLLREKSPDRVEIFNGRHACSKFCVTAATGQGIPFNTLEITCKGKPIVFQGHVAHDRLRIQERMRRLPVDPQIVHDYFERRRRPATNKFARKHATDFVPPDASGYRKKVTVFLSSQDEFEALGRDWKTPFPDYAGVIYEACSKNPDMLFCIRYHPNQADMASDITTPFERVRQLPNTVIYYPHDTANSYTLMEWSDVVMTFGSTVTIEACWMGKPTIMLGPSFYDQLDVSCNPASVAELQDLLRQDLQPRPAKNASALAIYQECDFDPLRYVGHDGKKMVSNGITLHRPWLSQISRTSNNVFCRLVKGYSRWYSKRRHKAA